MSPRVSIVTTVYDRADCLARCLKSVQHSTFQDYEQIVVSDAPPASALARIAAVMATADSRVRYLNLPKRANNWGITPAAVGLRESKGEFVCFLSDDNAYLPNHLGLLVDALDADPGLGFVYSSCQYAGRLTLDVAPPQPARIDLGQPMFRRDVFRGAPLNDDIPFNVFAWDWHMIHALLEHGVRWQHVNEPTFIFRLTKYPKLMRAFA